MTSSLESIPPDTLYNIFHHLDIKSLYYLSLSSKLLHYHSNYYQSNLITKFDFSEQNFDIGSLQYILYKPIKLDAFILDCRGQISDSITRNLSSKGITDQSVLGLPMQNLVSARYLVLKACNKLTEIGLSSLLSDTYFPHLAVLNLSNMSNLSAKLLQSILRRAPKLTYLCLERSNSAVTDTTLRVLSDHCFHIRTLNLSHCTLITDLGIGFLSSRTRKTLNELSISHCYDVSSVAVVKLVPAVPNLTALSMEWCYNIDDNAIYAIAEHCTELSVLGLEHCERVTDEGLSRAASKLTQLSFLSMDSCSYVADKTLYSIATSLPKIQDLYLNSCCRVRDKDIEYLANNCKEIKSMGIEECELSDRAVRAIAYNFRYLKVLGLNSNFLIGDSSVITLVREISGLERLYLSETSVTNKSVIEIAKNCSTLQSLSLVGCNVNADGLLALGDPLHVCSRTLHDLHLSSSLRFKVVFYSNIFFSKLKREMNSYGDARQGLDTPFVVTPVSAIEFDDENSDEGSFAAMGGFAIESDSSSIAEEITSSDLDDSEDKLLMHGILDVQEEIFGGKRNNPSKSVSEVCIVYLR